MQWLTGSPRKNIKQLYLDKDLQISSEHNLAQGNGVYLTNSEKIARAYAAGGSIYYVNVENITYHNFSTIISLKNHVAHVVSLVETYLKEHNVNFKLANRKEFNMLLENLEKGNVFIEEFGRDVQIALDCYEDFHKLKNVPESYSDDIEKIVNDYVRAKDGYTYISKDLGTVLIIKRNVETNDRKRGMSSGLSKKTVYRD